MLASLLVASAASGAAGQLPVFNGSRFKVINRAGGLFGNGDLFQLDGIVEKTSGHVTAKHLTGQSPDHEIFFGEGKCSATLCQWPLTIVVDGNRSTGRGIFVPSSNLTNLAYTELKVSLQPVKPPNCGDSLPVFNSSLFKIYNSPPNGTFENGDLFLLNGSVDNTSGHVAAKHISGKSPDHQIIFGNSTCEGTTRRWPMTIVLDGKTSNGACTFSTTSNRVSITYNELKAHLMPTESNCGVMFNKTSCTSVLAGQCEWCVSKDNVHELCFATSHLPDTAQWDCASSSVTVV